MTKKWLKLNKPPIILAVMEIKFQLTDNMEVHFLKKNDSNILQEYPIRSENFTGNINLPFPAPGISSAQVSSKQIGYTYINKEKTRKFTISKENIVYTTEGLYLGWDVFKKQCLELINYYKHILKDSIIIRISIRFINRINFDQINSPLDYFNTTIAAKDGVINYPIDLYSFKYVMHIPDTNIKVNVIQSLEEKNESENNFVFDIDVLCHDIKTYDETDFSEVLEKLREIKNEVFFNNITEKTLKMYETA